MAAPANASARGTTRLDQILAPRAYRPAGVEKLDLPLVLVGKTVTFDSGGISLKPALDMEHQKADMGGGAAVFGALTALLALDLPLAVTASD